MKVVAFNGSSRANGNTYTLIRMFLDILESHGIETEIVNLAGEDIHGCKECYQCFKLNNNTCALTDDKVNEYIQKMTEADGILLASPVFYSNISGTMKCFLERAFFVMSRSGALRHKVGAAITAVRRSGGLPTLDAMNRFLSYCEMILPTSNYWPVIHGSAPGQVEQDEEGKQIIRLLAENFAWLLKLKEYGKDAVEEPKGESKITMNFIR